MSETEILKDYEIFYKETYGDFEKTPIHALSRRKDFVEKQKIQRLKEFPEFVKNNRMKRIAKFLKDKYLPLPTNGQYQLYENFNIRFKILDMVLIFNVLELKEYISQDNILIPGLENSEDEIFVFSDEDISRINRIYDRVCPGKSSAIIYEQNLRYN